jgi:uncharacterized membrane protein SpoIIM required for sporulation
LGLTFGQSSVAATSIFLNNIKVTFLSFAGGIAAGIITAALLIYNGLIIGAVGGISIAGGSGARFFALVVPHGLLELSCIAVASAAGLRLARALIEPGPITRGAAVMNEARPAVEMVLGTIPWLILAGLVEGFVTPRELPLLAAGVLGCIPAAVYWGLVMWRGRPASSPPVINEPASSL